MTQKELLTVGILIFDGVEVLDFCGPFEVFASATTLGVDTDRVALFRVVTIAEEDRVITCNGGLLVQPMATMAQHPPLDILLVPGGDVPHGNARVLAWIRQQDQVTRLTTSVCTGAFLLAESGLLHEHRATTHWTGIEALRRQYPTATVLGDVRFVDEGHIVTAAGVSAGIDMSLHVVSRLFGSQVAAQTARDMEYAWRGGGADA
jgi:transcriptional regulator GlxA family with amidase domain